MARSAWKFNYMHSSLYKNVFPAHFKTTKLGRLFCTSSTIPEIFLKKTIVLDKGCFFNKLCPTKYMRGYQLGEFNVTRKPFRFPQKKNKR